MELIQDDLRTAVRKTFGNSHFVYLMKHLMSLIFGDIYCPRLNAVVPHKNTTLYTTRCSADSSLRVVARYCQQGAASQTGGRTENEYFWKFTF